MNKYKGVSILMGKGNKLIVIYSLFEIAKGIMKNKKKKIKKSLKFSLNYFSLILLLICLLCLKIKDIFSSILICSPVLGFLPILSFLFLIENVPNPLISTLFPDERDSTIEEKIFCIIFSTSLLGRCLNFFPTISNKSDLFIYINQIAKKPDSLFRI